MFKVSIGKCLLDEQLLKYGMSRPMLIDKTGISKSAVSMYVSGERMMTLETAFLIARAIGCQVDELYSVKDWKK